MKTIRQLCVALTFTLALTIVASAGEMHTTVAPPEPATTTSQSTANGEIQTGLTGQEETGSSEVSATASATEIALNLLQSVLALF
jgi:hypothetical protein